jgi:hypothetical protein
MKKISIKSSKIKEKVCQTCGLQKKCGDLPGFCLLIYYVPVALAVGWTGKFAYNNETVSLNSI